jgi:tetratricopeptide (TPR) repeat protein
MEKERIIKSMLLISVLLLIYGCYHSINSGSKYIRENKELSKIDEKNFNYFFSEALRLKMDGNIESLKKSLVYYQKCLEINPDSDASMYQISNILIIGGDYENALKYAKKATDIDPDNIWYQLILANLYHTLDKKDSTILVYNNILEKYPERINLFFNLAALYRESGKIRKSLKIYEELENKYGKNERTSIAMEQIYEKIGKVDKAEKELLDLIEAYPEELKYYGMLAELYSAMDMDEKANEVYNEIFEKDPDNELAQLSVIEFYRKKGEYGAAFKMLDKIINDENLVLDNKMKVLISFISSKDELDKYNSEIRNSIELLKDKYSEDIRVRALCADYFISAELYDSAVEELRYIVDREKANYLIWEQLMFVEKELRNYEKLYEESIEAIKVFSMAPILYLFKGIACIEKGYEEEAVETFKLGIKLGENNKDVLIQFYSMMGEAYRNKGEYKLSDEAFEKVLELDNENLYVLNNYSYYLSLRGENLPEALKMSKLCIEKEPDNSTYLDTYAWVLYKMKKYKKARKYLEMALNNNGSKNREIVEHYGDIMCIIGEKESALEYWKKAKRLGKVSEDLDKKISDVEQKCKGKNK